MTTAAKAVCFAGLVTLNNPEQLQAALQGPRFTGPFLCTELELVRPVRRTLYQIMRIKSQKPYSFNCLPALILMAN